MGIVTTVHPGGRHASAAMTATTTIETTITIAAGSRLRIETPVAVGSARAFFFAGRETGGDRARKKEGFQKAEERLEASEGIEPPYKDLQSSA
jgi:hypothetical protein